VGVIKADGHRPNGSVALIDRMRDRAGPVGSPIWYERERRAERPYADRLSVAVVLAMGGVALRLRGGDRQHFGSVCPARVLGRCGATATRVELGASRPAVGLRCRCGCPPTVRVESVEVVSATQSIRIGVGP
jgi:hypothetical protein